MDLMGDFLKFSWLFFFSVIIIIVKCTWVTIVVDVPKILLIDTWAHLLFVRTNELSLQRYNNITDNI